MPTLASSPLTRHGRCRFSVEINGKSYVLSPLRSPLPKVKAWRLRSATARYAVASSGSEAACSCPDGSAGVKCKHIGALTALGLIRPSAYVARPSVGPTLRPVVAATVAAAASPSKGGA